MIPGRGQSTSCPWAEAESVLLRDIGETLDLTLDQVLTLLGETCLDVQLNGSIFWSSIPANVWEYTSGGALGCLA